MKAWQLVDAGVPLNLADVPEPSAAFGEVLIDVKASGLCHSDVSAMDDPDWREIFPSLPLTLGHEQA
jgi:alcohol dehydrogenase, propanol-preferring